MDSSSANDATPIYIREVSVTSFIFEICMKPLSCIRSSPIFNFGGHDWYLMWKISSTKEVHLGVFLISDQEVKATVDFTLLDKYGNLSSQYKRISRTFSSKSLSNYRDMLLGNMSPENHVTNGCFNVLCTIFIDGKTTTPKLNQNPNSLVKQINNLLLSRDISDVAFEVDGKTFHAHRAVLATRSPVFKAELFGQKVEANTNCIKLEGMMSEIFKELLCYIYTDTTQDAGTKFNQHLLEAADRYSLDGLRKICEDRLCSNITLDTVLSSLGFADQHNCSRLLDSCLNFAATPENLLQLTLRQEYLDLMKSFPFVFAKLSKRANASLAFQNIVNKKQTVG
ncbi:BTB/POZ/MATH-domain protein [Rhynchospora pubera]|uniref:BTB/POZ/MATH-domain protein n=1 Tax=Rhynchospora pubera TaxID=906938 RepID=A0AAV8ERY8_9POAL|nr:BTB/POZ/MATH-domain protein [Rhynchospora pubera]KAJ4808488.1 BTB/POZ/MATH-domain protein [Rhynchospora pubera]